MLLLDWEMAQLGDPAWDVGAALHAFITEAVLGLELTDGTKPEAAADSWAPSFQGFFPPTVTSGAVTWQRRA